MPPPATKPRGRPKAGDAPASTEEILSAALRSFARHGYDGTSIRTLNRELGVSHNLIHQRFGSKDGLWHAAVDHAFGTLVAEVSLSFDPTLSDPLGQLNHVISRFLVFSSTHPELLALMNAEGTLDTARLDYIFDNFVRTALEPLGRLVDHLAAEGRIRPVSLRSLWFLIGHGAATPFTLRPFALRFDASDPNDPDEAANHAQLMADVITEGLRI